MSHDSASTTPPLSASTSDSTNRMAASLPQVNFGFEELKDKMARFTVRFDESIEKGRKRILEEKNEFAKNIAEDKDTQRMLRKEIDYYKQREQDVANMIKQEAAETTEAEAAIAEISRKKITTEEQQKTLQAQIAELQEAIKKKRELRAHERKALASQASHNAPELAFWEDYLGMRIEGAGVADHLKIVFTHLVDSDWTKEFWFIVNMVTRDYHVIQTRPKLQQEVVDPVVDRLNDSRDFAGFLKEMRGLFKQIAE